MRRTVPVILFVSLFAASQLVAARGPSGGGSAGSSDAPHFGGPASNSKAAANSNGRFASDRETGLDRAAERMSDQGKAHEKATDKVDEAQTPKSTKTPTNRSPAK